MTLVDELSWQHNEDALNGLAKHRNNLVRKHRLPYNRRSTTLPRPALRATLTFWPRDDIRAYDPRLGNMLRVVKVRGTYAIAPS